MKLLEVYKLEGISGDRLVLSYHDDGTVGIGANDEFVDDLPYQAFNAFTKAIGDRHKKFLQYFFWKKSNGVFYAAPLPDTDEWRNNDEGRSALWKLEPEKKEWEKVTISRLRATDEE